jgi:uncharacterized protein YndB with AHSA1/START domain
MSRNSIFVRARPELVFDVLDDACAYPRWVVGARRVRCVDAAWPAVGSRFHHALGTAVGELHDSSKVLERDRPQRMALEVRFRPTGVARVDISVEAAAGGSTVTIEETPICGPVSHVPRVVVGPLLKLRNAISLQRLRHEVERSSARSDAGGTESLDPDRG